MHSKNNLEYTIRNATDADINEMIKLFSTVFSTYPSPIYDEEYLKQTMNKKVLYKVAVYEGKIVSVAAADMDNENLNAEITDCATYPTYGGKGILSNIIHSLEYNLKSKGFITLYSLSRAINPSINFALSKHNYSYAGGLVNNCNICGTFEDMNIWVKNIHN
jgi:putative beta-lysine N-acetyltransferase